ncbi:deoxyguanosinetriphosphate triphosphohydrolase family protein [Actinoplanes sp. RD1]|uniref:deoxyguanosinetriphosphate triphosphohydrolase family protein n=1 Tax=Actinoplanes sp. RD1 TaxID=3064538 RepID=UPI002740DCA0|nr:dNTP triphosphohydrolase [Actinoplanes sp. RD1]
MYEDIEKERKKNRSRRNYAKRDRDANEYRYPAEKDRDRVLYSAEFRRLAGITQVAAVHERHLIHNRLTHSLKVAQMGRRIAERLLREEPELDTCDLVPDVVEVAGLAHDLGHPPFGHAAESALRDILDGVTGTKQGFEGNAQSFRIVTKLCVRNQKSPGLDLTLASLSAILKYPQFVKPKPAPALTDRSRGKKRGAYRTEEDDFIFARGEMTAPGDAGVRSPNAIIMDWADDISFATHDLEDFIHAGLVRPETLVAEWKNFRTFVRDELGRQGGFQPKAFNRAANYVESAFAGSISHPYDGSRRHQAELHSLISSLIMQLDRGCHSISGPPYVCVDDHTQYVAEILKHITTYYVVMNPNIRAAEVGQQRLVTELHEMLVNSASLDFSKGHLGRPRRFWDIYDSAKKEEGEDLAPHRAAADYICTLTEEQAVDLFLRMSGRSRADSLGVWLR